MADPAAMLGTTALTPAVPTLYDCTLRRTKVEGRVKIVPVPPEEVRISKRATSTGRIPFIQHRKETTPSDLIAQGYDADSVNTLPTAAEGELTFNRERVERFNDEEALPGDDNRPDRSMRPVWVEESYIWVDYDGDGVAELRKVVTGGDGRIVLTRQGKPDIETIEEQPLISLCPIPMPHKKVGKSLADLVMDLQFIKSTLLRQMLDNIYLANNPRTEVADSHVNENTYDDLLNSRPGSLIRTKMLGGLQQFETPFVAEKAFGLIEYIDQTQETRTGVDRRNQGLAPDDLNKTAAAASMYQQAAAQRVELIARIFAETGIKELCRHVLGLVTRYQQHERIVRLTGKYVPMDPRHWDDNMDISVSVGLGTGNKDLIAAHMKEILQAQFEIVKMQQGVSGPLVYAKDVHAALEYTTESLGLKQSFFTDPEQPPPQGQGQQQPPKPDPEMLKVQAQIAAVQAKAQAEAQIASQKAQQQSQIDQQHAALDMQLKDREMQHRMQLEQQDAQNRFQLEQQKMVFELEMTRQREAARLDLAEREFQARASREAQQPQPGAGA